MKTKLPKERTRVYKIYIVRNEIIGKFEKIQTLKFKNTVTKIKRCNKWDSCRVKPKSELMKR